MGKHSRTVADETASRQSRESVAENIGTAYWSVDDRGWSTVQPGLPGYMVDLLAPPIVVATARVVPTSRLSFPGPAAPVPASSRPVPARSRPHPAEGPTVAGPASPGRHHRPAGPAGR